MNRATRDKFASGTVRDLMTGNACWESPPKFYDALCEQWGPFHIDLTGDPQRHLRTYVPNTLVRNDLWFGPGSPVGEFDALTAFWRQYGRTGYSNPPYGPFVQAILARAKEMAGVDFESTLLLPMRVTKAFKAYVLNGASDLIFLDKRLTFFENGVPRLNKEQFKKGRVQADPALFDSILVRFLPGRWGTPRLSIFEVPEHVTKDDLERAAAKMREAQRGEDSGVPGGISESAAAYPSDSTPT